MFTKVELTQYDPDTNKYVATLTVEDDFGKVYTYSCDGTWQDGQEGIIAKALYNQHATMESKQNRTKELKTQIESKINASITALIGAK